MKKTLYLFSLAISFSFLNAQTTFTANTVGADTLKSTVMLKANDISATGITTSDTLNAGNHVVAQHNLEVKGDIVTNGNMLVNGSSTFNSILTANQGVKLNANSGFKLLNGGGTNGTVLYGALSGTLPIPCAAQPQQYLNHAFGGALQIFNANALGYAPNSGLLTLEAYSNGACSIEASNGGNYNLPSNLFINYYCGSNTFINTGAYGGWVNMGEKVNMAKHLEIGNATSPINDPNNTALEIRANAGKGINFKTTNNTIQLISVTNSNFPTSPFTVNGDGRTKIGVKSPIGHTNAMLTVDGKIVSSSLYVLKPISWSDKVFSPNYPKENLKDVAAFINSYKHLPGIDSEQKILENGYDINEMNAKLLEKVENLYLHVIELEKQIELLKVKSK
jgi:hypothetical protein